MTRILVVDDSPDDRRRVGSLLEGPGLHLFYAVDVRGALVQVQREYPDLVLAAIEMAEVGGVELVERLRETYPTLPVVLLIAEGSSPIAVEALQAGAASYVSKRNLAEDLWPTVFNVLNVTHERRANVGILNRLQLWEADFELENELKLINSLSTYLLETLKGFRRLSDVERLRVGIALEESLMNSYYHGNLEVSSSLRDNSHEAFVDLAKSRLKESPYCERRIHVQARITSTEIQFRIRDDGPGFDVRALPNPTDPRYLERPHGRGLLLMRTFLDEVRYNERGNEVTLVKRVVQDSSEPVVPPPKFTNSSEPGHSRADARTEL